MIEILPWTVKDPLNLIGFCSGKCYESPVTDTEKNVKRAKNGIKSNHGRITEYPDIYCTIEGYSARCIRELARHIIGTTFLQSSTRYVDEKNLNPEDDFYYPDRLTNDQKKILEEGYKQLMEIYTMLEDNGVVKEDAANILPLGMHSGITYKINLRALEHFFHERACSRAYLEIRQLCSEFKEKLRVLSPEWEWICDNMLVPKCEYLGYCPELKGCGRKISKEEMLQAVEFWVENKNCLLDDGK